MRGRTRQRGRREGMPDEGRSASEPSAKLSRTKGRRRSRSPIEERPNEAVQLAGADEEPPAGITNKQRAPRIQTNSYIDFEQLIKESSILTDTENEFVSASKSVLGDASTHTNAFNSCRLPSLECHEETLRCGSDDMSAHVPTQIKQKIWQQQYINIALLLKGNVELQELCSGGLIHITESGNIETRPKITKEKVTNIEKWTDAFLIFSSIYLEKFPNKTQELLQYMSIIREAASRTNTGLAWRLYDEQFRLRQAIQVQSWDHINADLWLRVLGTSIPNTPTKPRTSGTNTCNFFNQGYCSYNPCRFPHVCSHCGGTNHGRINCFQLKDNASAGGTNSSFRKFRGSRPFNRGGRNFANRGNRQ